MGGDVAEQRGVPGGVWVAAAGLGVAAGLMPPAGHAAVWGLAAAAAVMAWFRRIGLMILFLALLVSSGNLWDFPLPGHLADVALGEWWLGGLAALGIASMLAIPRGQAAAALDGYPWKPLVAVCLVPGLSLLWNGALSRPLEVASPLEFGVGGWGLLVITVLAWAVPAVLVPDRRWGAACLGAGLATGCAVLMEELVRFVGQVGGLRLDLSNKLIFAARFPFLGVLALILLVHGAALAVSGPRGRWRAAGIAVAGLAGLMAMLTIGRAIWLGGVVALLWLAWRIRGSRFIAATLVLGVGVALGWEILSALYIPSEKNWAASRFALWQDAWALFGSHWLLGIGPGAYYEQAAVWEKGFLVSSAHNNYLQVLVELGLLGFATCAWMVGGVWRVLSERVRSLGPGLWRAVALGAEASLAGLLVASCFGDYLFVSVTNSGLDTFCIVGYFWLFAGLAAASRRWDPVVTAEAA